MNNKALRDLIYRSRVRHYEIAQVLGVSEFTFSRWLRGNISEERESQIRDAISLILHSGGETNAEIASTE